MSFKSCTGAAAAAVLTMSLAGCGSESGEGGGGEGAVEEVRLSAVSAWKQDAISSAGLMLFKEKVEELSDGQIEIQYRGGPEAIDPFELGEAVKNGVVDVAVLSAAYYNTTLPAATALSYSEYTAEEELEDNRLDVIKELHETEMNVKYLGRGLNGGYAIYMRDPVDSLDDLAGKTMRITPAYLPIVEPLGIGAAEMPGGEVYQAMERGVVDGFFWPDHGATDLGLQEVTGCMVRPSFWQSDNSIIFSLGKWETLSTEVQEILQSAADEVAVETVALVEDFREQEAAKFEAAGAQQCELTDADELMEITKEAAWEWVDQNVPEDQAAQLEEALRK